MPIINLQLVDKILPIKEKYFNAILNYKKPFELRHEPIKPNSIVKLECENGRYLIFKSGKCELLNISSQIMCSIENDWWDDFCKEYCKQPTYSIDIKKILEVK